MPRELCLFMYRHARGHWCDIWAENAEHAKSLIRLLPPDHRPTWIDLYRVSNVEPRQVVHQ